MIIYVFAILVLVQCHVDVIQVHVIFDNITMTINTRKPLLLFTIQASEK